MAATGEQRKLERIRPLTPLAASAGSARAFILDASLDGFRIAHQDRLAAPGASLRFTLEWDGRIAQLECVVEWTEVQRVGKASYARTLHHSGLRLHSAPGESADVLRELIEHHVRRALDEQRANAHGIPAVAAHSYQTGRGTQFVIHEFLSGQWRTTSTTDPRQPPNGFTVSTELSEDEAAMLRAAFEAADTGQREMIKTMARLSISTPEGIPTRRYQP